MRQPSSTLPPPLAEDGGILVLTYCQLLILELACQGVGRNNAVHAAFGLYARHLIHLAPRAGWHLFQDGLTVRYGCLALSAAKSAEMLGRGAVPPEVLGGAELDRVLWLLECTRRVAHGGEPLLLAARSAHDLHLGRPRQRRRPVEAAWLAEQVAAALDAVWAAIRLAPKGIVISPNGWGSWLADTAQRPVPSS